MHYYGCISGTWEVVDEAAYVDDVVIPVISDAENLIDKVSRTCSLVIDIFSMYGMSVNLSAGKTEVVMNFIGVGSRLAKIPLAQSGHILKVAHKLGIVDLRVVSQYKHVGIVFSMIVIPPTMLGSKLL